MNRSDFAKILNSIVVPEGIDADEIRRRVFPISQASFEMLPNRLFRYRPCGKEQIDALANDAIYAVTADKYNDPYDTLVKCNADAIKDLFRSLLSVDTVMRLKAYIQAGNDIPDEIKRGSPGATWEVIKKQLLALTDTNALQGNIERFLEQLSSQMIVFFPIIAKFSKRFAAYACFSEAVDSILMWSHYADSHKGFVLEYDFRPALANPIKNTLLLPVVYSDDRFDASAYMVWAFLTLFGSRVPKPDLMAHIKASLFKSLEWEYEKEWRMIDGTPRNNPFDTTPSVINYKPNAIYYGCEMVFEDKQQLHEIAVAKGIKEYEMYIDLYSSKYEMRFREYR